METRIVIEQPEKIPVIPGLCQRVHATPVGHFALQEAALYPFVLTEDEAIAVRDFYREHRRLPTAEEVRT